MTPYRYLLIAGLLAGTWSSIAIARGLEAPQIGKASETGRYIVVLADPPTALFDGQTSKASGGLQLPPTSPPVTGGRKLDFASKAVGDYRSFLAQRRSDVLAEAGSRIGRELKPLRSLDLATNGMILELSSGEAKALAGVSGVKSVTPDKRHRLHTDAGPAWVGATAVWQGDNGVLGNLGEGVIVGVIDQGVNWDHPAFDDIGGDGFNHTNPLGRQLGLCSNAGVRCTDKLIGVYDFTNEGTRGRDTDGHGTHVASTAVGNIRTSTINGITVDFQRSTSGVAPHANLITYKVCVEDDPDTSDVDEEGCSTSAILSAIDQAVADGVDVANYSIGGDASDPWTGSVARAMLSGRAAGVLFVTSAGNAGPVAGTISEPANAPWLLAVGNITHNRRFSNSLEALVGGNGMPPGDLQGVGLTGPFGPARIVHARDFGNALCGEGEPELQPECEQHTGSSNPFAPGTFDGEIVVCDRGTYGRVEKGFNLRAAGAGGYVLANTDEQGESIVSDDHCLPAVHIGDKDGDELRAWLDSGGDDHSGMIAGQFPELDDAFGDVLSSGSSRGPADFVAEIMKPDMSAPGTNILAAGKEGSDALILSGTSMASPHVAGAAALVLAANPALRPDHVHSILVSTAVNDGMLDATDGSAAGFFGVGAGRLRVDRAVNAGLAMSTTISQFNSANPQDGGDPSALNLPGMVNDRCLGSCAFVRRVTDVAGGGTWQADFEAPEGVQVTVIPETFELGAGETQSLDISIDVSGNSALLGSRVEGAVVLVSSDQAVAETRLPFSVFSDPGDLVDEVSLRADTSYGSSLISLDGLVPLPDAEFEAFGLSRLETAERSLVQDPTRSDPYDSVFNGAFFELVELANDGGFVLAETVVLDNGDLDLFVGRDDNGDGLPDEQEELCVSNSPDSQEECLIEDARAGTYWILLQNWASSELGSSDNSRMRFAAIEPDTGTLRATGPGHTEASTPFRVRAIWEDGRMLPGETWVGLLAPKAVKGKGQGVLGLVQVKIKRRGGSDGTVSDPDLETRPAFALGDGQTETFSLEVGEGHGRLFVDVDDRATRLVVRTSSSDNVDFRLVREDFTFDPPGVPVVSGASLATAEGPGGDHEITIDDPEPGRYYIVLINAQTFGPAEADVTVELEHDANTVAPLPGLYFNPERDGAGFNLNTSSSDLIIEWYTYLENGTPTWYLAQAPFPVSGNRWQADLMYFSWNGEQATPTVVGEVMLTFLSETELVFSFRVNGESSSERYRIIVPNPGCDDQGAAAEDTGLWYLPTAPGFGYSVLSLANLEVHINYLYDGTGFPRWVLGQDEIPDASGTLEMSQFSGFCPTCGIAPVSANPVGTNEFLFEGEGGNISTDVDFRGAVPGAWMESGSWLNLTPAFDCNSS